MACSPAVRRIYALMATVYAFLGLIEFGHSFEQGPFSNARIGQNLTAYMAVRLALGVTIPVFHMGYLWPMRFETPMADKYTTAMGGGNLDAGIRVYYNLIAYGCNVMLPMFVVWGAITLGLVWYQTGFDALFVVPELISIAILSIVAAARYIAICSDKVWSWFYLAWSNPGAVQP